MQINFLAQMPTLYDEVTRMLHHEWSELPDWRDQQVIRQRLKLRARGILALWLYTPDQQTLYRRFGWQDVEQRDIAEETVTVMMLRLD